MNIREELLERYEDPRDAVAMVCSVDYDDENCVLVVEGDPAATMSMAVKAVDEICKEVVGVTGMLLRAKAAQMILGGLSDDAE